MIHCNRLRGNSELTNVCSFKPLGRTRVACTHWERSVQPRRNPTSHWKMRVWNRAGVCPEGMAELGHRAIGQGRFYWQAPLARQGSAQERLSTSEWPHGWQLLPLLNTFRKNVVLNQSCVVDQAHLRSHSGPGASEALIESVSLQAGVPHGGRTFPNHYFGKTSIASPGV